MNKRDSTRDNYLKRVYGISLAQYQELLKKQGGGCAICGKTPEQEGRSLSVDHDHKSNFIRGLLCSYDNHRIVGRHRDPDLLRRVADYISQNTGWSVPSKKKKKRKKK